MNKKLLFVCQYFYPEKISSGVLPYEMACELNKEGFDVTALVGYPKEYSDESKIKMHEEINGIKIHRIKYFQSARSNFIGRIINYLSFCFSVWMNKRQFNDIDQCICYTNPPLLPYVIARLSKKYNFDLFFEIYDLYPDVAIKSNVMSERSMVCKMMNYATNYALKQSKKIILLSHEMKTYLINTRESLNLEEKSVVIPNWYKKQEAIEKQQLDQLTILYGGNMGILQDMDTLLESIIKLKDYRNIHFVLAGHGVKKQKIVDSIEKHNLSNCTILDFIPKNEYDELLKKVDLAIVSLESFGLGLGSPSKVYGYLALGLPIIAIMPKETDVVKDILEFHNGIYVQQNHPQDLVNFLIEVLENRKVLKSMSESSLNIFNRKYELSIVKKLYIKMLKEEFASESI